LHELLPIDFYIALCAHPGRPAVLTAWFDPSVTDETDPLSLDPSLHMDDPANGPPYSPAFVARYRAAQAARNHRITQWCHQEIARLQGLGLFDRAFNLYRTWADLRMMDGHLDPSAREVGRCYAGDPKTAHYGPRGLGLTNTLRTWLSMWSLSDAHCGGAPHRNRLTVPGLVMQSTGDTGVFPSDAQSISNAFAAEDKTLAMMPGDHYLEHPGNARDHAADLIAAWLQARDAV
jgi:hypothetical protein